MEITEVKVFPVQEEKLKAFVSVVFDHCFMVNDIKVIQGRDGLFISMPSRRKKNGEFKDVAHPLNNDCRRMIEIRILDHYERALNGRGSHPRESETTVGGSEERVAAARSAVTRSAGTVEEGSQAQSLKDVEEMHLRDSFWTVP